MKCSKLIIETDGTAFNTSIIVDGKKLTNVIGIKLFGNTENPIVNVILDTFCIDKNDNVVIVDGKLLKETKVLDFSIGV